MDRLERGKVPGHEFRTHHALNRVDSRTFLLSLIFSSDDFLVERTDARVDPAVVPLLSGASPMDSQVLDNCHAYKMWNQRPSGTPPKSTNADAATISANNT